MGVMQRKEVFDLLGVSRLTPPQSARTLAIKEEGGRRRKGGTSDIESGSYKNKKTTPLRQGIA